MSEREEEFQRTHLFDENVALAICSSAGDRPKVVVARARFITYATGCRRGVRGRR